jgi:hypothetical protein
MEFLKRIPETERPTVHAMLAVCDSVELALLCKNAPRQGGPDPIQQLKQSLLTKDSMLHEVRKVIPMP